MKKILITGGSHAEIPLIQSAKSLGYYVITTGNNFDGLGHKLADEYIAGDFSDKEFVYNLAKDNNVSAIVSGCNDFAYISTAYACEKLNLPGHDTYENAVTVHHKNKFMSVLKLAGVRTPKTFECSDFSECVKAVEEINFPIILKPVDLTGGKGVSTCNSMKELEIAYENALKWSREKIVVIEEFIVGENHGASFLLKNQKVVFAFFDNEQYYLNKYLVSGACHPSNLNDFSKNQLISDVEKVAKYLNLADGLFHTQFICDKNNFPVIIDPCRRSPGDLYIKFVKYSTEVDYPLQIVKAEIGQELDDVYNINEHMIARECIMTDSNGIFDAVEIDDKIKNNIIDSLIWAEEKEPIDDFTKYKAGILFLEFDNKELLYDRVKNFHSLVTIKKV